MSLFDNTRFSYANRLSKRLLRRQNKPAVRQELLSRKQFLSSNAEEVKEALSSGRSWYWLSAVFLFSAIIHIVVTLMVPYSASQNSWARLAKLIPANEMQLLSNRVAEEELLPLLAPDVIYALCRYDLSQGQIKISTRMPSPLWSIAIYNQYGDNFYAIMGVDLQRSNAHFVLLPPSEQAVDDDDETANAEDIIPITSLGTEGLIIIRAPLSSPAYRTETHEIIQQATCQRD